ncbi:MAG: hypothetical protein A2275_10135 [Bacteroidetes bacterium RIFOXYA12_FULL_35_11]|nr:MAG: hypothetical protein A2X01_07515 [Bacteroidetes bacterium GWF2_35_48]OFY73698.1 MAG: hypothetical protein A2275_10135 [Bacteroidetes bacterium RIFOXYA12_FULL_35_11]OFY92786.1 MAG: hypothetical protein A2491_05800 [Bacteroidetes bacterium RIFOXYC12_FULL_35_7]OFY96655.1 MAG: hypothetical protein A2309_05675 [Bacteroidetes bacterium RIFOXYB2_FULL_35_7]HBX52902.1 glycosyl transferase [Bacteroidales bacterium]
MQLKVLHIRILIFFGGLLIFVPFWGQVHLFDWDEINFAESAREMLLSSDFLNVQIDYNVFWEKPPLFIWMQALSMKIFGVNEFAARLPNAICGAFTLLVLFNFGRHVYGQKFGLLWVLVYVGSILPLVYFKSGIIDPWFNLFIFLGVYYFIIYQDTLIYRSKSDRIDIALSALFLGLAVLTKGPAALLIFGLCGFVYLIICRFRIKIRILDTLMFLAILAFVGGFWFLLQIANGNYQMVMDFIVYQIRLFSTEDAGHGGFPGYHFVILLFGVFPASVFALKAFRRAKTDSPSQVFFKKWMIILFWTVLILFSIVKTKIVHYSSLCYFPLTFLAAHAIYRYLNGQLTFSLWQRILIIFIAGIFAIATCMLPLIDAYKQQIIEGNYIKDAFAVANLHSDVSWPALIYIIPLLLLTLLCISFFMKKPLVKISSIFISVFIFTNLMLLFIIPRVEQYTQNAAIEFYKKHKGKDCIIRTWKFKSYAHLFYAQKPIYAGSVSETITEEMLITKESQKPVYFICKITSANEFEKTYPQMKKMYEKNGFVFFEKR